MQKNLTALYKLAAILIVIASVFYFSSGALNQTPNLNTPNMPLSQILIPYYRCDSLKTPKLKVLPAFSSPAFFVFMVL